MENLKNIPRVHVSIDFSDDCSIYCALERQFPLGYVSPYLKVSIRDLMDRKISALKAGVFFSALCSIEGKPQFPFVRKSNQMHHQVIVKDEKTCSANSKIDCSLQGNLKVEVFNVKNSLDASVAVAGQNRFVVGLESLRAPFQTSYINIFQKTILSIPFSSKSLFSSHGDSDSNLMPMMFSLHFPLARVSDSKITMELFKKSEESKAAKPMMGIQMSLADFSNFTIGLPISKFIHVPGMDVSNGQNRMNLILSTNDLNFCKIEHLFTYFDPLNLDASVTGVFFRDLFQNLIEYAFRETSAVNLAQSVLMFQTVLDQCNLILQKLEPLNIDILKEVEEISEKIRHMGQASSEEKTAIELEIISRIQSKKIEIKKFLMQMRENQRILKAFAITYKSMKNAYDFLLKNSNKLSEKSSLDFQKAKKEYLEFLGKLDTLALEKRYFLTDQQNSSVEYFISFLIGSKV